MLIKIKESEPEFVELVEELKQHFKVGSAGKTATMAIRKFKKLFLAHNNERQQRRKLEKKFATIKQIKLEQGECIRTKVFKAMKAVVIGHIINGLTIAEE
ncbi:MAG: hypothetical protein HRT38_17805 [Alteromonadaceae bacterium]|nr:hypothetical protein [Alteromonadaceae bacterium]